MASEAVATRAFELRKLGTVNGRRYQSLEISIQLPVLESRSRPVEILAELWLENSQIRSANCWKLANNSTVECLLVGRPSVRLSGDNWQVDDVDDDSEHLRSLDRDVRCFCLTRTKVVASVAHGLPGPALMTILVSGADGRVSTGRR